VQHENKIIEAIKSNTIFCPIYLFNKNGARYEINGNSGNFMKIDSKQPVFKDIQFEALQNTASSPILYRGFFMLF
jgi:hypothetical protein